MEFDEPDGTKFNLDVDVSPPTIPVILSYDGTWNYSHSESDDGDWKRFEDYDGNNEQKRRWLEENRPVNWLSEWKKSYDMTAAGEGGKIKRAVRLRRVNRNLVIPEQVF